MLYLTQCLTIKYKMKTILITFFISFSIFTSFAQDSTNTEKHMEFKGIPIDGNLNEYVLKMKKSGFSHLQTENGAALLNGEVAGYKNCYLLVQTIKQNDLVYVLVIMLPEVDTWSILSGNYYNLKELLTEKYGEPSETVENFNTNYTLKDDGDKMYEVRNQNCNYKAVFHTENGGIDLSINHDRVTGSFVKLVYVDYVNSKIIREITKRDL